MNFGLSSLGRLVAGVRGFYNEINSATLTGAIDVLIVQQEDGTYTSSPFHVRFGKLGVLRSRQKVVDITINGVPVEDLHMKLGEAGEAFFVELVEDDSEIDESVLDQLATSPIPTDGASLMEKGIAELKDQVKKEEATATRSETTPSSEKTPTFRSSISLKLQDLHPETAVACKSDSSHDEMSEAEESRRKVLKKRRSRSGKSSPRSPLGPDAERGEMFEMDVSGTESSEEELSKATLLASQLKEGGGNLNLDSFGGHPLSDPELSPVGSPLPTRPPSPKSDSEVDKQRQEESQSGMLMDASGAAKWEWGGFPQTSTPDSSKEPRSPLTLTPAATAPPSPPKQTPLSSDCTDSKPPSSGTPPASVPSKESGDQGASPDTAASAKCKEEAAKAKPEPKYLSELDLEDPEVAKLYLSGIGRFETIREKDEDTESGRGASLPQSPHSVEGAVCGPTSVSFLQSEVRHLGTFSLSLCGGLAEPEELNLEKFMLKVVTYDDLCENPGIVHNPDLVVKVNDKYYNWATAAPMVLSQAVYHKDLSEKAVKSLAKEHMPRKEKKKRGGLSWLWRRGQQDSDDAAEVPRPLPTSSTSTAPTSVSSASSDSTHKPTTTDTASSVATATSVATASSVATVAPATDVAAPATTTTVAPPTTFSVSVDTAFASTIPGDATGAIPSDVSETVSVAAPRLSVSEGRLVTTAATTTNASPRPTYTEVMTGSTTSLPMSSVAPVICKDQHSSDGDTDGSDRMSSPELSPPSSPPRKSSSGPSSLPSSIPGVSPTSTRSQRSSESSESPSSSVDPTSPHPPPHTESSPDSSQKKAGTPPKSPSIVVTISPSGDMAGTTEQTVVDMPDSAATTPATAAVAVAAALGAEDTVVVTGEEEEEKEEEGAKPPVHAATTVKPKEGRPRREKYIKSLRLSSEKIAKLNLHEGVNEVIYSVTTAYQGTTRCCSHIFLWKHSDKIVISDIDGTITRSDVLGQILPIIGKDWSQFGVANLFTRIADNGYKLLYLSARAIGQSRATKEMLKNIRQDNAQVLPLGPLLLNPTSLLSAFHREVIERKPEEFKINCLKDIADLFPCNPFYAGFGNKINDVWTYQALNVQKSRIFTINHRGQLINEVNQTYQSSYSQMSSIVDHVFPPIRQVTGAESLEFSNFNYWRTPLPDLAAVEKDLEDLRARDKKSPPSSPKK